MTAARMPTQGRHPHPAGRRARRIPGLVLLLGIWLVVVQLSWTYGDSGSWLDARWNDMLVGMGLVAISIGRLIHPILPTATPIVTTTLGMWLVIAPFLAGYGFGADSTPATVNDVLVGAVVTGLAAARRI
jgi:hypothetical protein